MSLTYYCSPESIEPNSPAREPATEAMSADRYGGSNQIKATRTPCDYSN